MRFLHRCRSLPTVFASVQVKPVWCRSSVNVMCQVCGGLLVLLVPVHTSVQFITAFTRLAHSMRPASLSRRTLIIAHRFCIPAVLISSVGWLLPVAEFWTLQVAMMLLPLHLVTVSHILSQTYCINCSAVVADQLHSGGASWCGGTGRPPLGATLLLLNYFFQSLISCMLLLYWFDL